MVGRGAGVPGALEPAPGLEIGLPSESRVFFRQAAPQNVGQQMMVPVASVARLARRSRHHKKVVTGHGRQDLPGVGPAGDGAANLGSEARQNRRLQQELHGVGGQARQ